MYPNLLSRFLRYCAINTRSDARSTTVPTTVGQQRFLTEVLVPELQQMGLADVHYDAHSGFVTATHRGTVRDAPTIGFIAHVDTADFNADHVRPRVHPYYDGSDIALDEAGHYVLSVNEFPNLANHIGDTLITTSGDTLLGADDKAGIVEILSAIEWLQQHPDVPHGDIRVAFGPDEEIGRGADLFDVERFAADFAYTIDSGTVGRLEYETFNAAQALIHITGRSVHPGTGKGRLINALTIAVAIAAALPVDEVPERTSGYEGFFLLHDVHGTIDSAQMTVLIRDHDARRFAARKQQLQHIVDTVAKQFDGCHITVALHDQYKNMKEIIEQRFEVVTLAVAAMRQVGIEPIIEPFRGGTDGSKISHMGLPTPNLFTGGDNFHGRYEYITLENMEQATQVIVAIVRCAAQQAMNGSSKLQ